MTRLRTLFIVPLTVLPLLAGCTGSSDGTPATATGSPSPLGTSPAGASLCGFVPATGVAAATGATDLKGQGGVSGEGDGLVATCTIYPASTKQTVVQAGVLSAASSTAQNVRARMQSPDGNNRVLAAPLNGLATVQDFPRDDGTSVKGTLVNLFWGNFMVGVSVQTSVPGRDAAQDATAIDQQIAAALNLSARATLKTTEPTP